MSINKYEQNISLDLNSNSAYVVVNAKQWDQNTRQLNITFTEDGVQRAFSSDTGLQFRLRKPDGTIVILDTKDSNAAISKSSADGYKTARVVLTSQCLAAAGRGYADVLEYYGEDRPDPDKEIISAASFILNIMSAPNVLTDIRSDSQYSGIFEAVDMAINAAATATASASTASASAAIILERVDDAEAAASSAIAASNSAQEARVSAYYWADRAFTYASSAALSSASALQYYNDIYNISKTINTQAQAVASAEIAATSASNFARIYASDASGYKNLAEAWAIGTIDGHDVPSGHETYHNNAKYWAAVASAAMSGMAPLASPSFTGTPTAPTPIDGTNNSQIATTAFVQNTLKYTDAMIFKGTIGTGGTITSLPSPHEAGWTYKVITAGTYAGKKAEVGDLIICIKDRNTASNADWTIVQSNIDGAVTGPSSATNNNIVLFNGTSGTLIKDGGYSIEQSMSSASNTIPTSQAIQNKINSSYVIAGASSSADIGEYATIEGSQNKATGTAAHAEGLSTVASGEAAHAEGEDNIASGRRAHAEGFKTKASGHAAHAEGMGSEALGDYSHAEGTATASGDGSHAEGLGTIANGANQHVFGKFNIADASNYVEIVGNGTNSTRSNARTLDWNGNEVLAGKLTLGASASDPMDAVSKGYVDTQIGAVSSSISALSSTKANIASPSFTGTPTAPTPLTSTDNHQLATTKFVHNVASGLYITAGQNDTSTMGGFATAEGKQTQALGNYSHAEGLQTTASGMAAHAEGHSTIASNEAAHAEGWLTTASSNFSHAEGQETTASGEAAHAEGAETIASNEAAHAEGLLTTASEMAAHAEGAETIASGGAAHAEGYGTIASGEMSHTEGTYTIANHRSQHVFGEYNIADTAAASSASRGNYVEIVGNGTSSTHSNARTLDWNGNETLAGKLTLGANGVNSMDAVTVDQHSDSYTTKSITNMSIASFNDGANNIPIESFVVQINPIQVGGGDPSPTNPRTISGWTGTRIVQSSSANAVDPVANTIEQGGIASADGQDTQTASRLRTKGFIPVKPGEQYTASWTADAGSGVGLIAYWYFYGADKGYLRNGGSWTGSGAVSESSTVIIDSDVRYVRFLFRKFGDSSATLSADMVTALQLESGSMATPYQPGSAAIEKEVSWQSDAGMVYGGTLRDNGDDTWTLTATSVSVDMGNVTWVKNGTYFYTQAVQGLVAVNEGICSIYAISNLPASQMPDAHFRVDTSSNYAGVIYVKDSRYESAADLKAGLSGQTMVLPLIVPATYTLHVSSIKTLLGANNIFCDTSDITELTYRVDPNIQNAEDTRQLLNAYPHNMVSGAVASFTDGADDMPVCSLTAQINPVQIGSGDPSPSNPRAITGWTGADITRCGRNLFSGRYVGAAIIEENGVYSLNALLTTAKTAIVRVVGGAQYTIKKYEASDRFTICSCDHYPSNGDILTRLLADKTLTTATVTIPADGMYLLVFVSTSNERATPKLQIEAGETATAYQAYTGNTYNIAFPAGAGTVYSGTLNVTTGVLTINWISETYTSVLSVVTYTSGMVMWKVHAEDQTPITKAYTGTISNIFGPREFTAGHTYTGASKALYLLPYDQTMNTKEQADAWLTANPTQVVFEVETPIVIQLDPVTIKSLLGENNIFCNTGDIIELAYRVDPTIQNNQIQEELNLKAPLASPVFTGTPMAPTADIDDSEIGQTNQIATVKYINDIGRIVIVNYGDDPLTAIDKVQSAWTNAAFCNYNGILLPLSKRANGYPLEHIYTGIHEDKLTSVKVTYGSTSGWTVLYDQVPIESFSYGAYPTESSSGAIASTEVGADNIPLKQFLVPIDAVWGGSGTPSINNIRPINGWNETNIYLSNLVISQQPQDVYGAIGDTVQFSVVASGTNISYQWQFYNGTKWANSTVSGNKTDTITLEVTEARYAYSYHCNITDGYGRQLTSANVVIASSAGDVRPRANPDVYGGIINVPFGQTIYGGTLDVMTGVLTVTHWGHIFNGTETLTWFSDAHLSLRWDFPTGYEASASGTQTVRIPYSSHYPAGTTSQYTEKYIQVLSGGAQLLFSKPNMDAEEGTMVDKDAFIEYLVNQYEHETPVTVVWLLETPVTFQLSPNKIKTVLGPNELSATTGNVEVVFRCDSNLYIDSKLAALPGSN